MAPSVDVGSAEIYFAKKLANNEKKIRDRALKRLKSWLTSKGKSENGLNEEELLKLWKGLFYCMWFSDKPLVQEELADNLADIINVFKPSTVGVLFSKIFFVTIGREWLGIDRLRLDKFYMLTKKFLKNLLQYVSEENWNKSLVEETSTFLKEVLLDIEYPVGLKLFITENLLDMIKDICEKSDQKLPDDLFGILMRPLFLSLAHTKCDNVIRTTKEHVMNPLCDLAKDESNDHKVPLKIFCDDLCRIGADKDITTKNRKILFHYTDLYRQTLTELENEEEKRSRSKRKNEESVEESSDGSITSKKKKKKKKQAASEDAGQKTKKGKKSKSTKQEVSEEASKQVTINGNHVETNEISINNMEIGETKSDKKLKTKKLKDSDKSLVIDNNKGVTNDDKGLEIMNSIDSNCFDVIDVLNTELDKDAKKKRKARRATLPAKVTAGEELECSKPKKKVKKSRKSLPEALKESTEIEATAEKAAESTEVITKGGTEENGDSTTEKESTEIEATAEKAAELTEVITKGGTEENGDSTTETQPLLNLVEEVKTKSEAKQTPKKKKKKILSSEDEPKPFVEFLQTPTPKAFVRKTAKSEPRKMKDISQPVSKKVMKTPNTGGKKSVTIDVSKNKAIGTKELTFSPLPAFNPDVKPSKGVLKTPITLRRRRAKAHDFF